MQAVAAVYQALCAADRPCKRAEIENIAGLDKSSAEAGLRGLARRSLLDIGVARDGAPVYSVRRKGATIEDLRARKSREHRAQLRDALLEFHGSPRYSPARPPSHAFAAGTPKPPDVSLRALVCKLLIRR